jgi:hypothetical protein
MLSREIPSHLVYGSYIRGASQLFVQPSPAATTQLWGLISAQLLLSSVSPCGKPKSVYTRSRSSTGALDSFHLCRPCTRNTSLVTRAHTVAPHQLEPAALWPTSSHFSLKGKHIRLDDAALAVRPVSLTKFEFDFIARRGLFIPTPRELSKFFKLPPLIWLDLNGV